MSEPKLMSEPKFTPGDWEFDGHAGIVTEDHCIANLETDGGYEVPGPERRSNGFLIAAAPVLFDALTKMVDFLETNDQWEDNRTRTLNEARKAIAKATGQPRVEP